MTRKKLVIVILSAVGALALVAVLFVGGIAGALLYTLNRSAAAQTAREFLRKNEKLKSDIGEVRGFGSIVTGGMSSQTADGAATLNLKVIGAKKTVNAHVSLAYLRSQSWVVTGATYTNDQGRAVTLLDPYQLESLTLDEENGDESGANENSNKGKRGDSGAP